LWHKYTLKNNPKSIKTNLHYENNDYPKSNFSKPIPPAAIVLLGGIFTAFPAERK
jgi:hypothetical protein